jgi:hypothetical protein
LTAIPASSLRLSKHCIARLAASAAEEKAVALPTPYVTGESRGSSATVSRRLVHGYSSVSGSPSSRGSAAPAGAIFAAKPGNLRALSVFRSRLRLIASQASANAVDDLRQE